MPADIPHADLVAFLAQAVVISFSGVLAPGPVTAMTLGMGASNRNAGALIAVGHGIVELPLMVLIIIGVGSVFELAAVRIGIGLAGGAMLLLMGAAMLRAVRGPSPAGMADAAPQTTRKAKAPAHGPVLTGIVLSAGNPYFLLWWATVGLALASRAVEIGILAFALFAALHWLCDLVWLQALSWTSFKGSKLLGGRSQRIVSAVCGTALLAFGAMFLYRSVRDLLAAS